MKELDYNNREFSEAKEKADRMTRDSWHGAIYAVVRYTRGRLAVLTTNSARINDLEILYQAESNK